MRANLYEESSPEKQRAFNSFLRKNIVLTARVRGKLMSALNQTLLRVFSLPAYWLPGFASWVPHGNMECRNTNLELASSLSSNMPG